MNTIGFVGFGEVASIFCAALRASEARVLAYDIVLERPDGRQTLAGRVKGAGPEFVTLAELLRSCDTILSTVTTDVALAAARQCAAGLAAPQVYVDMNATSPAIKRAVGEIVEPTGASFVEGAILGAVGVTGARTRVLLCGRAAEAAAASLNGLGLNVAFYGTEIGRGSTFKLLRSVFSKGLEALLLEAMLAARHADVIEDVWEEILATLREKPFAEVGGNWMLTHGTAHERRWHEMVQVEELLRGLGLEPLMTGATTRFFERSTRLRLAHAFQQKPDRAEQVVAALDSLLRTAGGQGNGRSREGGRE